VASRSKVAAALALALACTFAGPMVANAASATPSVGTDNQNQIAEKTLSYAKTLVGKLPSAAGRAARAHGYFLRIVAVDGQGRAITMDYWANRIDLEFTKGRISKVSVG